MYIGWFKNVPEADKLNREATVRSALLSLGLDELLQDECALLDRQEVDPTTYDTPNWDYRQAHKNGQRAMLEKVRKIISLN
jgi:hypothetical protein